MKQITFIAAIAVIGSLSFTSCKKSHTCTCKDSAGKETKIELPKAKKSDAKTACSAYNTTYSFGGGSCSL